MPAPALIVVTLDLIRRPEFSFHPAYPECRIKFGMTSEALESVVKWFAFQWHRILLCSAVIWLVLRGR